MQIALGLFFAVSGLVCFLAFGAHLRHAVAASRWPAASGRIVEFHVRVDGDNGDGDRDVKNVTFTLQYAYEVGEHAYIGHRIGFFPEYWSEESARRVTEQYVADSTVRVRYDPRAPERSVLRPWAFAEEQIGGIVFGAGALGLGIVILVDALR